VSDEPRRPWWVPLLGVGSLGLGGFQGLGGMAMAFAAAELGGEPGTVFLGLAAGWFLTGALLAASGIAVVAGSRRARALCVAAPVAMAIAVVLVAWNRDRIPPAVVAVIEYGEKQAGDSELVKWFFDQGGRDAVARLRDPDQAALSAWAFAVEFGIGTPWYLLVLAAGVLPAGRRIVTPGPPGASPPPAP
jgi:hypothetical protein